MSPPHKKCIRQPAPIHKEAKAQQGQRWTIGRKGMLCLSTLPDLWPLAKITIDMEKPSQWVSKLCRLYFADEYARRTVGMPSPTHTPDIEAALQAVQAILPKLEVKMSRMVSHLSDTSNARIGFFFRPTPYGFRQVVQHVSKHVAK